MTTQVIHTHHHQLQQENKRRDCMSQKDETSSKSWFHQKLVGLSNPDTIFQSFMEKKLAEAAITQVFQLDVIGNNNDKVKSSIPEISETTTLTIALIQNLHLQPLQAENGEPPQAVNHLLADNPYELWYGEKWKDEIKKVKDLRPHVCAIELVTHIVNETNQAYIGTKYEETYLFYHNALWQMKDNLTIN